MTTDENQASAIDAKHPSYTARLVDWQTIADCYAGERTVKAAATKYLPATSGQVAQGQGGAASNSVGQRAYDAYKLRAVFHNFVREAVTGLMGVIHRKPPVVKVPPALEPMVESMTIAGESLELLWRRVTEAQLLDGRCGLLVDVPDGETIGDTVPYVSLYSAATIVNWDAGQRRQGRQVVEIVVLDESSNERQENLTWLYVKQHRVLTLDSVAATLGGADQQSEPTGDYVVAVVREEESLESATFIKPSVGSRTLDRVPFVFINVNDLTPEPDAPPFLGLANLSLAIYRGEADYRHTLYMQGQSTLVRIGANPEQAEVMTGAGAIIDLNYPGDAKYIGIGSAGLAEQRSSLENDKKQASQHAVQLLDTSGGEAESGEALRVRVSARTATLASMQLTAAAGVRDALVLAGRWLGLSDEVLESIEVTPNLDFSDATIDTNSVSMLMDAVVKGAPLSLESIHAWLVEHEYTTATYEEELERIAKEKTAAGSGGKTGVDIDPAAPSKPALVPDDEVAA